MNEKDKQPKKPTIYPEGDSSCIHNNGEDCYVEDPAKSIRPEDVCLGVDDCDKGKEMKDFSKASKKPWKYHSIGDNQGHIVSKGISEPFVLISTIADHVYEANATLIVEAVNKYDLTQELAEAVIKHCGQHAQHTQGGLMHQHGGLLGLALAVLEEKK